MQIEFSMKQGDSVSGGWAFAVAAGGMVQLKARSVLVGAGGMMAVGTLYPRRGLWLAPVGGGATV